MAEAVVRSDSKRHIREPKLSEELLRWRSKSRMSGPQNVRIIEKISSIECSHLSKLISLEVLKLHQFDNKTLDS